MLHSRPMCGRAYQTMTEDELIAKYRTAQIRRRPLNGIKPNFNLCPTHIVPLILFDENKRCLDFFRWGLVPAWAKDVTSADKYSLINARSEEITEKRSYKEAFLRRRCIVPLSGFYEWKRPENGHKIPYAIYLKEETIMSVAGIWELWRDPSTKEVVYSFSILTVEAKSEMSKVHHRMPVLLDSSEEEAWLDPELQDPTELKKFCLAKKENQLNFQQVSSRVNSPKNNDPTLLDPV